MAGTVTQRHAYERLITLRQARAVNISTLTLLRAPMVSIDTISMPRYEYVRHANPTGFFFFFEGGWGAKSRTIPPPTHTHTHETGVRHHSTHHTQQYLLSGVGIKVCYCIYADNCAVVIYL